MKENIKGFIAKDEDLDHILIKVNEDDDWIQYSDDDHEFQLSPDKKTNNNVNSLVKLSYNNNSFQNKNDSYKQSYNKKNFNDKNYNNNNDYAYNDKYSIKGDFTNTNKAYEKNYDKKNEKPYEKRNDKASEKEGFKTDRVKDYQKSYNHDEGKKNYNEKIVPFEEARVGWNRGSLLQSSNRPDEYQGK